MGRQGWVLFRVYLPAVAFFALALLVMIPLGWLHASPFVAGVFDALRWVPVAIGGGAILLFGVASYRLWRWDSGNGPSCVTCGGPLGYEREGRADRGGAYRRCYTCGKAVNHQYYE